MTASELIAILKSHPKACTVLRLKFHKCKTLGWTCWATPKGQSIWFSEATKEKGLTNILNWLTGAAVRWHVANRVGLPCQWIDGWTTEAHALGEPQDAVTHPTILHALLAAIDAAEETT